ncbi:unnamed protein product [Cyprideis torosa]|uniref:Uncharacterized protein n=1 Tax=Cyprideis torosa TaxID=163714 RepID=A0A7R8ZL83_9CRUS|nr:unnamed protein product [Cyprideis torosa]CAG0892841.1 unnamed protein product [Cyprideis torosa]
MKLTFAAPNGVYYNKAEVRQVDVPSQSGAFGILANHVPTLAVLSPGVVTMAWLNNSTCSLSPVGSITVNDDSSVQVLAEEAVPVEQLDTAACRDTLQWAQAQVSKGGSEEEKTEALIALQTAEALVKACEG